MAWKQLDNGKRVGQVMVNALQGVVELKLARAVSYLEADELRSLLRTLRTFDDLRNLASSFRSRFGQGGIILFYSKQEALAVL
jgi:hypothetical protein